MNNQVLSFYQYINESSTFKGGSSVYGIKERWDGGYDIRLCDSLLNGDKLDDSKINIAKKTEKAVALAYVKVDGSTSQFLWIPAYACKKEKYVSSSGAFYTVEIPSYTYWFKEEANRKGLENFLNDFVDVQESKKRKGVDLIIDQAKEDIDLILDQFGLNDSIASLERTPREYEFDGITENGLNVVILKRSNEDLVGDFKIYSGKSEARPIIEMNYSKGSSSPSFRFNIDGKNYTVYATLSETETNPYLGYLILRSLNKQDEASEESLVNYYTDLLRRQDWNYQYSDDSRSYKRGQSSMDHISEVESLISDFMSEDEISKIRSQFSNPK